MSVGLILLIVAGLLVLLGVGQRVLDKLRLTDKQALLFIALIIAGGFLPEIPLGGGYFINVGGALIPLGLCVYLLVRCQSWQERLRALIASLVTAVAVYAIARFSPDEPEAIWIDPNYLYGLVAGVIGYIFGRSRRGAFIAGVLGVILMDVWQGIELRMNGIDQAVHLGGAGALDAVVLSGLTAVLLSELLGALLERITGAVHAHAEIRGGQQVLVRTDRERGKDE